ncbi:MAG: thioredoxin family protein [Gammaproteobacteria bacterium]|jgi:thioredoxin 1
MNTLLIVSFLVIVFLFIQLLPHIKAREIQGRQIPDLSDVFTDKQCRQQRLLLYFWSPKCSMCRGMTPVIDKLVQEREDVISINAAENVDVARRFKVMGTPTLVLLKNGKVDKVLLGAKSEKTINALLS